MFCVFHKIRVVAPLLGWRSTKFNRGHAEDLPIVPWAFCKRMLQLIIFSAACHAPFDRAVLSHNVSKLGQPGRAVALEVWALLWTICGTHEAAHVVYGGTPKPLLVVCSVRLSLLRRRSPRPLCCPSVAPGQPQPRPLHLSWHTATAPTKILVQRLVGCQKTPRSYIGFVCDYKPRMDKNKRFLA